MSDKIVQRPYTDGGEGYDRIFRKEPKHCLMCGRLLSDKKKGDLCSGMLLYPRDEEEDI